MDKYTKAFFITFLFVSLVCVGSLNAQPVTNGTVHKDAAVSGVGKQFGTDGFQGPKTRKEERLRRKARRLSLSRKQLNIYNRKQRGKDLNIIEKIRYPRIKHKKDKLDALQKKADGLNGSTATASTSGTPGYLKTPKKYQLSIKEKDIIAKYNQDSTSLSDKELKLYKKAQKKQKKQDKYKKKNTKIKISSADSAFLWNSNKYPDSLTNDDKARVKQIKRQKKHNKKIQNRIRNYQIDSLLAAGEPVPITKRGISFKRMFKKKQRPAKPSHFVKKLRRAQRRYSLTDRQKTAYNNRSRNLSPIDRHRANRAEIKNYLLPKKLKKIQKKEYLKSQPRNARRSMRKDARKLKRAQRKTGRSRTKQSFFNLFKKRT